MGLISKWFLFSFLVFLVILDVGMFIISIGGLVSNIKHKNGFGILISIGFLIASIIIYFLIRG